MRVVFCAEISTLPFSHQDLQQINTAMAALKMMQQRLTQSIEAVEVGCGGAAYLGSEQRWTDT